MNKKCISKSNAVEKSGLKLDMKKIKLLWSDVKNEQACKGDNEIFQIEEVLNKTDNAEADKGKD